jgi:hypothetical protein
MLINIIEVVITLPYRIATQIKNITMSINLLDTVQQNLGFSALQKMDPNTHTIIENPDTPDEERFSQAAIPAVLAGLYKYVQSDEGANEFLQKDKTFDWMSSIFGEDKKNVIQSIAKYSLQSGEDPVLKMNLIANEAVRLVKENIPAEPSPKDVRTFMHDQLKNILLYLPDKLKMGLLLNDSALDDNTNKMEGPVSSLLQSIGSAFSQPVTLEEITPEKLN